MTQALYGPQGFYRRGEDPGAHFRTSVHATPLFAEAITRLVVDIDRLLGHPDVIDVVDVGAGRGELLTRIHHCLPDGLRRRTRLTAVEVRPMPVTAPAAGDIQWLADVPHGIVGLVLANEWLDNLAVDVVTQTGPDAEPRYVTVDPRTGVESVGTVVSDEDRSWLDNWWPMSTSDLRTVAEVGRRRDEAWAKVVTRLTRGVALAIDYSHTRSERACGAFAQGTLTGYREGREVLPVPDGRSDLTAHVALDACLSAGEATGATASLLTTQRAALKALGIDGVRPPLEQATTDPADYVRALSRAGESGELLDPAGLGGFGWLVQAKGVPLPSRLVRSVDDGASR